MIEYIQTGVLILIKEKSAVADRQPTQQSLINNQLQQIIKYQIFKNNANNLNQIPQIRCGMIKYIRILISCRFFCTALVLMGKTSYASFYKNAGDNN